jgi:hypothetical protein
LLPILYCIGMVAWLVLGRGTWLLFRSKHLLPLSLYFLAYTALMCVWPFYDPRFWLPLLPLMAVMLLATLGDLQNRWSVVRLACQSYLICFFLLGLVALAFSTRISLSGRDFSELYDDGTGRMTYRLAVQNGRFVHMGKVSYTQVRLRQVGERTDHRVGLRGGIIGVSWTGMRLDRREENRIIVAEKNSPTRHHRATLP